MYVSENLQVVYVLCRGTGKNLISCRHTHILSNNLNGNTEFIEISNKDLHNIPKNVGPCVTSLKP